MGMTHACDKSVPPKKYEDNIQHQKYLSIGRASKWQVFLRSFPYFIIFSSEREAKREVRAGRGGGAVAVGDR